MARRGVAPDEFGDRRRESVLRPACDRVVRTVQEAKQVEVWRVLCGGDPDPDTGFEEEQDRRETGPSSCENHDVVARDVGAVVAAVVRGDRLAQGGQSPRLRILQVV